MSDVKITITADSKKGQAAIKKLDENVDRLGKTSKKAIPAIAGMWKEMAEEENLSPEFMATIIRGTIYKYIKDLKFKYVDSETKESIPIPDPLDSLKALIFNPRLLMSKN